MVAVKVIPEKGVEYKVWNKNEKHRVYFTVNNGGAKPTEVGNYDIGEGKFFPARGGNIVWNVVSDIAPVFSAPACDNVHVSSRYLFFVFISAFSICFVV